LLGVERNTDNTEGLDGVLNKRGWHGSLGQL